MPKVSVIVPIYNNEKYLKDCLTSIYSQTLKDIEIILVDDGSTDSSPQICDEYANKDNRIKVIHKENAGMGVSYNVGMDNATGDFIGFVESDDFIDEFMYEDLYRIATRHNVDIVKADWFRYTENYINKDTSFMNFNSYDIISPQDYPWILLYQFSVWSAIYKTNFLRNKNVKYLETPGASYQDVGFSYKAFTQAENIILSPDAYYYYRSDNENASVKSKEKSEVIFNEYKEVDRFFEANPQIKKWANTSKLIKQYSDYIWNYNRIAEHLKSNFLENFKRDFNNYNVRGELTTEFWDCNCVNSEFLKSLL